LFRCPLCGFRERAPRDAADAVIHEARAPNSYYQRARYAEAERDTWREHNGIARSRIADLEAKLAEAERLRDKYHAQSLSRKREIRRLNECFNRNHATGLGRNQLRAKWDNERARAGRISAARVAAEKERDAAIAERDYLKEQVATLERNLNNESEEHDAVTDVLKAERDTAIAERDKLIARIGTLEAQVHQMEGRLPTSNSKLTGVAHRDVETLSAECGRHQRRIAELCKKLQGFEQCDIDRVKAEEERDQLRAELKANAERLDTWRGQSADIRGALGLPHDAEWETVFQTAKEAKRSLTLWQNTYRTHFAPQHDETKHPNECTAAEVDPDTHWGPILEHVRALRSQAITLPTDTTTPLDLAQRAVALMGERLVALDGRTIRQNGDWYDILLEHGWEALGEEDTILRDLIDPTVTVTLAHEPEPERRKLTFGEAVECAVGGVVGETFATSGDWSIEAAMRPGTVSFYEKQPDGTRQRIGLRPAMLAAEWEAVS
ncbi:MAG: hypothetical protein KC492_45735, partial [Myxococcales bacterium]|nr:hypothetical protein [Myxococcales bacterium]